MHKIPELKSKSDLEAKDCLLSVTVESERLLKEVVDQIAEVYVEGTAEWIEENDPELSRKLREAEDELNAVWKNIGQGTACVSDLKKALSTYFEVNMKAIQRYKEHL